MPSAPPDTSDTSTGRYRTRLQELVSRIQSNSRLSLLQFDEYPSPPSGVFAKIARTFNCPLPADMVDFYSQVNGFKLIWRTQPEVVPTALGVIDILPVEQTFGGEHGRLTDVWDDRVTYGNLWTDELREAAPSDFEAVRNKRVFDRHLGRNQVLMELVDGTVRFFYYVDAAVMPLAIEFERLVDTVFATAGVEYYPEVLRTQAEESDAEFFRELQAKVRLVNGDFSLPA